jgi:hypothetical protein
VHRGSAEGTRRLSAARAGSATYGSELKLCSLVFPFARPLLPRLLTRRPLRLRLCAPHETVTPLENKHSPIGGSFLTRDSPSIDNDALFVPFARSARMSYSFRTPVSGRLRDGRADEGVAATLARSLP